MQTRSSLQHALHLIAFVALPLVALAYGIFESDLDYGSSVAGKFDNFTEDPRAVLTVALLFLAMQFVLVPAALAFTWLVHGRGRTLTLVGVALLVVSALGHAAFSGAQLLMHAMLDADDTAALREAYVSFEESGAFVVVALPGLAGLVLGSLLLGIGALRAPELPWWIGTGLLGFLAAEFFLGAVTEAATHIAIVGWFVAFWGAAIVQHRARRGDAPDAAT